MRLDPLALRQFRELHYSLLNVSQGWFLEPRILTHLLFTPSCNNVQTNCLLCLQPCSRHRDSAINQTKICSLEEVIASWISRLPSPPLPWPSSGSRFHSDTIPLALSQAGLSQFPLTLRKQGLFHVLLDLLVSSSQTHCLTPRMVLHGRSINTCQHRTI